MKRITTKTETIFKSTIFQLNEKSRSLLKLLLLRLYSILNTIQYKKVKYVMILNMNSLL